MLLLGAVITAGAKEVPQVMNVMGRQTMSLNGAWNYIVDVQEEGYYDYRMNPTRWGFFVNAKPQRPEDLIEYDFDKAETMQVPGDWNTQDERLFFYEGTVWLKKSFEFHPQEGRRTLIYFGAANYDMLNMLGLGHTCEIRKTKGCPNTLKTGVLGHKPISAYLYINTVYVPACFRYAVWDRT